MKQRYIIIARYTGLALLCGLLISIFISYYVVVSILNPVRYSDKKMEGIAQGIELFERLNAEKISLMTEDNIQLSGLLIPAMHPRRVILFCHGFHASKELLSDCVADLLDDYTTFFLFDFRAHGESSGSSTTLGYQERKDLERVIKFIATDERTKELPLYGIGISMGGAILLSVASRIPVFKGLVIDSTFSDFEQQLVRSFQVRTGLPRFPFMMIARYIFEIIYGISIAALSPGKVVDKLQAPALFIHSKDDLVIPFIESELLYKKVPGNKDLWLVESAKHGQMCKIHPQEYRKKIRGFIASIEK